MNKTARINVPVRRVDLARVDRIARQRDVSRAQVVREFVRQGLETEAARGLKA